MQLAVQRKDFATPFGCSCATRLAHVRLGSLMSDSARMVKEYLTAIVIMSILRDSARMCDSARSCATPPPPGGRVRLGSMMESMGRMLNIIKRCRLSARFRARGRERRHVRWRGRLRSRQGEKAFLVERASAISDFVYFSSKFQKSYTTIVACFLSSIKNVQTIFVVFL